MSNIALIKNNTVENIIVADLEFAKQMGYDEVFDVEGMKIGVGWIKQNNVWINPEDTPIPQPEILSILTPLEFLNRFTNDEAKTILTLSKTNVDVELWWIKYNKASFINLDDPQTIDGVNMLETAKIIGVGRANEILVKLPL